MHNAAFFVTMEKEKSPMWQSAYHCCLEKLYQSNDPQSTFLLRQEAIQVCVCLVGVHGEIEETKLKQNKKQRHSDKSKFSLPRALFCYSL